jgi:hypothetical protein
MFGPRSGAPPPADVRFFVQWADSGGLESAATAFPVVALSDGRPLLSPDQSTREGTGRLTVGQDLDASHEGVPVPLGALEEAPTSSWQVVVNGRPPQSERFR